MKNILLLMFSMAFGILANGQCQMSATINNVTCCGASNGTIGISAFGGTAPYNIAWTGPVSGNPAGNEINSNFGNYIISNLPAGTYTFTLTDANGCANIQNFSITEPPCLSGSLTSTTNCLCSGDQSGSITITSSGGVAPYDISWTGSVNGNPIGTEIAASGGTYSITNLPAGTYTVMVTDANNCTTTTPFTITHPSAVVSTAVVSTAIPCSGGQGVVTVSAAGGTPAYSGTGNFTVSAGTYTFTVTDGNGCVDYVTILVTQPSPLNVTGITSNNGIDITVGAGSPPWTYAWSTGTTTEDLTNLMPGTYTVTVTDANGCTQTDSFTVQNAEILTISASVLEIFPNPAFDKLTLKMKHSNNVPFYITDNLGRTVIKGRSEFELTVIPIGFLKAGLYLLHMDHVTLTFVKE